MRGMTGRNASSLSKFISNMPKLAKLVLGNWSKYDYIGYGSVITSCPLLIDLEFAGVQVSLDLRNWAPTLTDDNRTTFLQNFKEHIAERLTDQGSGKTLTLSQAVRDAIHAAEATYGIEAIIVTQKGWTLSPAPTA